MHTSTHMITPAVPRVTSGGGGTLYLVLIQVMSRAFTFIGNQFLLRYLSPSLLGLAVQLEVLSVTILYFSRESLRVALQRQPTGEKAKTSRGSTSQQIINLSYLVVLVGVFAAIVFGLTYLRNTSIEVSNSIDFCLAFKLYGAATLIELLTEPCFLIIQQHALYKVRARAETVAAICRCAAACVSALTMYYRHMPSSVLPFAIGQLFYAIALIVTYLAAVLPLTRVERFTLLPRTITTEAQGTTSSSYWFSLFSKPLLSLTATFYAQSVFKLLLTQGDALILSFLTDLQSQGAFALVTNYGGLLSRLVFQPVEESSRNIFGRLLNSTSGSANANTIAFDSIDGSIHQASEPSPDTKIPNKINGNVTTTSESNSNHVEPSNPPARKDSSSQQQQQSTIDLSQALAHLFTTLHLYTLFSLPLLSILPPLLPVVTRIILSAQWRSPTTTTLLETYLYYLPFIAVNGVLDAFVTTVASPSQLRIQSLAMAIVTGIYGAVAWILMATSVNATIARTWFGGRGPIGSHGLVLANMVNMVLRIVWSVWFVDEWVRKRQPQAASQLWKSCVPGAGCIVVAVAVGGGLRSTLLTGNDPQSHESWTFLTYVFTSVIVLGSTM